MGTPGDQLYPSNSPNFPGAQQQQQQQGPQHPVNANQQQHKPPGNFPNEVSLIFAIFPQKLLGYFDEDWGDCDSVHVKRHDTVGDLC